jgi:putative oxidoreductase
MLGGIMDFLSKFASQIQGILRIVTGLLFLEHGTSKMFHFPMMIMGGTAPRPFNPLSFPGGVSGDIEVVAGLLITLGFYSRYAAFIASGEMAIAYFMAHFPRSPFPLLNMGGEAVLYCFVFLFLAAAGPGDFSINKK